MTVTEPSLSPQDSQQSEPKNSPKSAAPRAPRSTPDNELLRQNILALQKRKSRVDIVYDLIAPMKIDITKMSSSGVSRLDIIKTIAETLTKSGHQHISNNIVAKAVDRLKIRWIRGRKTRAE